MFDAFRFKDKFDCWIEFEAKCLENIYLMKLHCALNEAQSLHSYRYLTKFSHFLTEKHYYKTAIISIFCISHNDIFFYNKSDFPPCFLLLFPAQAHTLSIGKPLRTVALDWDLKSLQ